MTGKKHDIENELLVLRQENRLLLSQCHQTQQQLEYFYVRYLELADGTNSGRVPSAGLNTYANAEEAKRLEGRVNLILKSTSWRITAPLRTVARPFLGKKTAPNQPSSNASLDERLRFYQRRLRLLEESTSWRVTSVFRSVGDLLRHGLGSLFGRQAKAESDLKQVRLSLQNAQMLATIQRVHSLELELKKEGQARSRAEQLARENSDAAKSEISDLIERHEEVSKRLLEDLTQARAEVQIETQKANSLIAELEGAKANLSRVQKDAWSREELKTWLEALFSEQTTYIQRTTNALGQHVTRMSQKQRDQDQLTHYMETGRWLFETGLSPAYAKALARFNRSQNHDAIVVFDSRETAEFLSRLVSTPRTVASRLGLDNQNEPNLSGTVSKLVSHEFPARLLVIEHQRDQCEALINHLRSIGLETCVEVVHAPWGEALWQNRTSLFYVAEQPLRMLHQCLKTDARVLVVIGTALLSAGYSRGPALEWLLQHLPTQVLDMVLEGPNSSLEKTLIEDWERLLHSRQIKFEKLNLSSATMLRVNC